MLRLSTLGTVNLTDLEGKPCAALLGQRKRLALFLYLTLSAPFGPTRRDTLLPLFWPESDDAQARRALRQVLHFLRRSLGGHVFVDGVGDGLLIDLAAVRCDAIAFERALDGGRRGEALELYGGDLLPGLFVSDAPQFERWMDAERSRLRSRATEAAWRLAGDYAGAGQVAAAEQMAARAAGMTPGDESGLCKQLEVLEQVGSFVGAIRAYEKFASEHAAEFGVPPAAATQAVARRLRARLDERNAAGISNGPVPPPVPLLLLPLPVDRAREADREGDDVSASVSTPWALVGVVVGAVALVVAATSAIIARRSDAEGHVASAAQAARHLYDEGLQLAAQSNDREASRFFHAAMVEDSGSALAAYHAALSETTFDQWSAQRDFTRAWRLTATASAHDALVIRQSYAAATNDPRALALADSLASVFPGEADGELALGMALNWAGRFSEAVPHLRRAIAIDSSMHAASELPDGTGAPCSACAAFRELVSVYETADSLDAAERVAGAWTSSYPRDPWAWDARARVAEYQGRDADALKYGQTGNALAPVEDEAVRRARLDIRSGSFAEADAVLAERARDGTPSQRLDALWWEIISLRTQGRLHDAMRVAQEYPREHAWQAMATTVDPGTPPMLPAAQVAFELGRYAESAAMFDSILWRGRPESSSPFYDAPGLVARHDTWSAAHLVSVLAAAGDTAQVAALADSMARWAGAEAFGRDRRLFEYARGLVLEARGDTLAAIDAFRRSVYSTSHGYTRAEYEAGRLLLAAGRAAEAVAVVQPALRGNLEASNYYVTRTELHELLGRAFAAEGARDSAAAHYRYVASSWQHADPPFRARAAAARAYLAKDARPEPY